MGPGRSKHAYRGLVVLKQGKVVELMTVPGRRKVAAELLAHACGDAIEHDHHSIVLHASPENTLHKVFIPEGASRRESESEGGLCYMARLLIPCNCLRRLCGEFCRGRRRPACATDRVGASGRWAKVSVGTRRVLRRSSFPAHGPQLFAAERGRLHAIAVGTARLGPRLCGKTHGSLNRVGR